MAEYSTDKYNRPHAPSRPSEMFQLTVKAWEKAVQEPRDESRVHSLLAHDP